jgi:16S rRNA (cytosine1402-N4)-methyltransferase
MNRQVVDPLDFQHVPVLLEETLEGLNPNPGHVIADCTVGGGGHALEIIRKILPGGYYIGLDKDPAAITAAGEKLKDYAGSFSLIRSSYTRLPEILQELGMEPVDGVLFDLGVSSHQLDIPERGFSYMADAPLDMRMDPEGDLTAQRIVNEYSQEELTRILRVYGEERWASRIAAYIVQERSRQKISHTEQLVTVIKKAVPAAARRAGPHPAKRTFQALRIAVNNELTELEETLQKVIPHLRKGGRICVISFHSLEDRIVKQTFLEFAKGCTCPPEIPICVCGKEAQLRIITRRPVEADREELEQNPRARSAKLRIAEKL